MGRPEHISFPPEAFRLAAESLYSARKSLAPPGDIAGATEKLLLLALKSKNHESVREILQGAMERGGIHLAGVTDRVLQACMAPFTNKPVASLLAVAILAPPGRDPIREACSYAVKNLEHNLHDEDSGWPAALVEGIRILASEYDPSWAEHSSGNLASLARDVSEYEARYATLTNGATSPFAPGRREIVMAAATAIDGLAISVSTAPGSCAPPSPRAKPRSI